MQAAAWHLFASETVVKTVIEFEKAAAGLRQVGRSIRVDDARQGLRSGQEVWATPAGSAAIQIAWEWTEIQRDVVALYDPMNILCNVALIDSNGHTLGRSKRMLHLNGAVHRLAWQDALFSVESAQEIRRIAA